MIDSTMIDRCTSIARSFGATKVILFGTAAESPETARDIDIACEGIEGWDLFRFGARLEEELGRTVDVVPLRAGDPFSRCIARSGRTVYDAG